MDKRKYGAYAFVLALVFFRKPGYNIGVGSSPQEKSKLGTVLTEYPV
jgi:hypothetical protein